MPRTPTYGRAAGPGDAVGSSIYELYAPQRASTEFGVDFARTGYEFQKEVEIEKQKQLDAQIAQSQRVQNIQEQAADKARRKQAKGKKVGSAATGATIGAQIGSAVPGVGTLIGGAIGGLGGWLFGEEGGMVPYIHPNSLLYKQYQSGGDVTGYSGGQPKFLRRGYQNLQLRQEDVGRAQENLDAMKAYGFWDAAMDVGKGYMAGKSLAPKVETLVDLAGSTLGVAKEKGWGAALDILTGKAIPGAEFPDVPELLKPDWSPLDQGKPDSYVMEALKPQAKKAMTVMKHQRVKPNVFQKAPASWIPARKSVYTRNPFKSKSKPQPQNNIVQDLLMSGSLGGLSGASGPR